MTNPCFPNHPAGSTGSSGKSMKVHTCTTDRSSSMRMWQLLSENGDTGAAIDQLLSEYEVDESTLHQDMLNWIQELTELGLILLPNED